MRLSVSDLDQYLYWREEEDHPLETLLKRLRREEPPTEELLAGRAFDSFLEHATEGDYDVIEYDGHRFMIDPKVVIERPTFAQLKGELEVKTDAGPVTLVGKLDGIVGKTIRDYKLTGRFDAERYMESYQWRCYLLMFNCQVFQYEIFVGKRTGQTKQDGHPIWTISEHHRMPLFSYRHLWHDVHAAVSDFASFLDKIGFEFPTREVAA